MEDGISRGLQHCHKTCCEKGGRRGRQACMVQKWSSPQGRCFRTGGLVYDIEERQNFIWLYLELREGVGDLAKGKIAQC